MDFYKSTWIQKLNVYKTHSRVFVIGSNNAETKFKILRIDRNEPSELIISGDEVEYSKDEIDDILQRLFIGNSGSAKWKKSTFDSFRASGIVGFVRFLEGYYAIFITKRKKVAEIGSHCIYKIEDTTMMYLPNENVREAHPDEARYLKIFLTVDLSSDFYFSYSYDLTNSLQYNLITSKCSQHSCYGTGPFTPCMSNSFLPCQRFVWNNFLTKPAVLSVESLWLVNIIHGHVTQSYINVYGQQIYITLIARRASSYAGTRFIKRGTNVKGEVANEVETEQIVHCASVSSIDHVPFTSFVQHRGSVPLHWQQDITANVVPSKPPITITNDNPYAQTTACHFRQLFRRFGSPLIVLNLVRKREKRFRESILGNNFKGAVDYLNQFLKSSQQIKYFAIDMAHLSRGRKPTVLSKLASIAEQCLHSTGFFQSKPDLYQETLSQNSRWNKLKGKKICGYRVQAGVLRTNCVDCLDRTNSAQFIVGKCALAYQLYSLGVLSEPDISFDTDALRLYEEMFEAHGDIVALQYGGSQLVHTIQSYRRTVAPWTSHSRDIVTTISRYYTNTFSDSDKQAAINLFLGVFRPSASRESLWDVTTDHHLHNLDADVLSLFFNQNYTRWWDIDVFKLLPLPYELVKSLRNTDDDVNNQEEAVEVLSDAAKTEATDWFDNLHNTSELTLFDDLFAINLNNSLSSCLAEGYTNRSPFVVRDESLEATKQEQRNIHSSASQTSLDLSSNETSDSDETEVTGKRMSEISFHTSKPYALAPWLNPPSFEEFSPQHVYGIDLDSCVTDEDYEVYRNYLSCSETSGHCSPSAESKEFYCRFYTDEPVVDSESIKLYQQTVYHTYEPDRKFYEDYLEANQAG